MSVVKASAPGKAFVCGEYGALRQGVALVAAIDRRVQVQRSTFNLPGGRLQVAGSRFDGDPVGDLVAAVVQTLAGAGVSIDDGVEIESDISRLSGPSGPLGLGSSAASAVALTAVLAPSLGSDWERLAMAAHRAFQGGRGSGYDVVTCRRGGMLAIGPTERVASASLPEGLALHLLTGPSVLSTGATLEQLDASGTTVDALAAQSARVLALLDDPDGFLSALREFRVLEEELGERLQVDIVPRSVRQLDRALAAIGGVCKPSGAGGDSLVVALVPESRSEDLVRLASQCGLRRLDAGIDQKGVVLNSI
jgi:phosphomevalonate kinase